MIGFNERDHMLRFFLTHYRMIPGFINLKTGKTTLYHLVNVNRKPLKKRTKARKWLSGEAGQ